MSFSLNNGIFSRDVSYAPSGNHFDRAHLSHLSPQKPTDLGIMDLWVQKQKKEAPLYTMSSFGGKNTIYSTSNKYSWKIPTQGVQPYIVEGYFPSDVDKIGEDGGTFKLKLSKRCVGHSAIITYDKFNGVEMYVTSDPIIDGEDGTAIYTFKISSNHKFVETKYLQGGTFIHRKTSARTEHSRDWDDFMTSDSTAGYREFFNYVGEHQVNVQYSVSEDAQNMPMDKKAVELWKIGENVDPSIKDVKSLSELSSKVGGIKSMKKMVDNGDLTYTWAKKLDEISLNKLTLDVENYLMWGQGGVIRNASGPRDIRMSTGLWRQLDNGFKKVYTRDEFSYEMFRAEIYNYFHGKIDFDGPDSSMMLQIQTGMGGMQLINKMIWKEINSMGLQMDATATGILDGDRMHLRLGAFADRIKMPFLANLEFVYNAAFDTVNNNPIENPIVDGFALSSYSFVVFDYNTQSGSDNICLIKHDPAGHASKMSDVVQMIQDGTSSYWGGNVVKSTGDFSGYKVKFRMKAPAVFVKDPTKILRFSMKNPITGFSL